MTSARKECHCHIGRPRCQVRYPHGHAPTDQTLASISQSPAEVPQNPPRPASPRRQHRTRVIAPPSQRHGMHYSGFRPTTRVRLQCPKNRPTPRNRGDERVRIRRCPTTWLDAPALPVREYAHLGQEPTASAWVGPLGGLRMDDQGLRLGGEGCLNPQPCASEAPCTLLEASYDRTPRSLACALAPVRSDALAHDAISVRFARILSRHGYRLGSGT